MEKLTHYEGLYGDLNHRPNADYIFSELIETRSKGFDWVINPHLHSHLYQLFCIESGDVLFQSANSSKKLQTPCLLVIPPNTLHGLTYSADVKGQILTISDSIFDNLFIGAPSLMISFETLKYHSFSAKQPAVLNKVLELITTINEELFDEKPEKKHMLYSCFSQLLIVVCRLAESVEKIEKKDTNATLQYYRRFLQSVKYSKMPKSMPDFAKELGITAVHLNRVCRQVAGKGSLLIVQEHLIQQAKNYLIHTSYSVSEIAYLLNFQYPNYFARLFKKMNGMSPKEFRNKNR
jgi:AraC family transcriptional activator of pobA